MEQRLWKILRMKPVFQETIWGGARLYDDFGYDTPSDHTGECWAVSAHPDGEGSVWGGTYDGTPFSVLWKEHSELFGNLPLDRFPLLTKIIDANGDLFSYIRMMYMLRSMRTVRLERWNAGISSIVC